MIIWHFTGYWKNMPIVLKWQFWESHTMSAFAESAFPAHKNQVKYEEDVYINSPSSALGCLTGALVAVFWRK